MLKSTPTHHRAWLAYGDVLVDLGQYGDATVAFERARLTDPERPRVEAATAALVADDRKTRGAAVPGDPAARRQSRGALCGLAALSLAADVARDAERLLRHALRQCEHLPLA